MWTILNVLNGRLMTIGEYNTKEEAEAVVESVRQTEKWFKGMVIPIRSIEKK